MSKKESEKALSALKEKSAEFKKLNFKGFKIKATEATTKNYKQYLKLN